MSANANIAGAGEQAGKEDARTASIELREENQRLRDELESFQYAVSHDLRRPIRHVRSFTQVLKHHCEDGDLEGAVEFADRVLEASDEAQQFLEGLLRLSRVYTRGEAFAAIDGNAVLNAALGRLAVEVEDSGTKIVRGPLPMVMADARQLEEILTRLIHNAIKFRRKEETPRVEVSAEEREGEWLFAVRDNGIGIDPKQQERIFVVFQRLHASDEYPGTGMGLAICKAVVERHGGRLWVDSEPDRGATFYFTIERDSP